MNTLTQLENQTPKSKRGGARPGAGRPRKTQEERLAAGAQRSILSPKPEPELILNPQLPCFIAAVVAERATFSQRLVPGTTLCLDTGSTSYTWPDGDAATLARSYAAAVVAGQTVAGRLVKKACQRFLDDLEHGAQRGLFFDPLAARLACRWLPEHCGLRLLSWQVFLTAQLFGFKRASGLRRFTELWVSVARKNGKSSYLGGVGLFCLICDGEERAEIYSAACTRDQARIIWRAAKYMAEQNPELKEYLRVMERSLLVKSTGNCFFQPLSSDANTLDGLNIHVACADEIHMHPSRDLTDRLTGGMAARTQPLLLSATTAGESRETFAFEKNEYMERVLEGVITNDSALIFIAELDREDDHKDTALWIKSNPSLGTLVREAFLKQKLAEIEDQPTGLNAFLRFHCNRWVEKVAGHSLPYDRVEACGVKANESPEKLRHQFLENHWMDDHWDGYDHGEVDDMSALAQLFPNVEFSDSDVKRLVIIPHYWMPEKYVQLRERQWGVPLGEWVRRGFIKLLPGDINDMTLIGADILKLYSADRPKDLGFDRYGGLRQAMAELIGHGFRCTEVPQTTTHLTEASKWLKNAVLKGEVATLNNPVLKWNLSCVELEVDERNSLMKPAKAGGDTRRKIDGVQATVTAIARWLELKPKPSVYDDPNYQMPKIDL
jgi:phage terminase large subunit-like protein